MANFLVDYLGATGKPREGGYIQGEGGEGAVGGGRGTDLGEG